MSITAAGNAVQYLQQLQSATAQAVAQGVSTYQRNQENCSQAVSKMMEQTVQQAQTVQSIKHAGDLFWRGSISVYA